MSASPEVPDKEQIKKLARETHYKLREKLIELKTNPPSGPEQLDQLQQETARLNRELFDHHLALYQLEGGSLNLQAHKRVLKDQVKDFFNWRLGIVKSTSASYHDPETDAFYLLNSDKQRWDKIFKPKLFDRQDHMHHNHWSIVFNKKDDIDSLTWTIGDIASFLNYDEIIAAYMKGLAASFFFGERICDGDGPKFVSVEGYEFKKQPRGTSRDGEPLIVLSKDGIISTNLS